MDAHPFRFMDLPLEIRFMVYENLPRRIVHQRIYDNGKPQPSLLCVLVTRPVSLSLMRTCRVVYEESRGVIEAVLKNFILINPPTVILNFTSNAPVILAALSWYLLHELRLPQATPELRWEQHITFVTARLSDRLRAKSAVNHTEFSELVLAQNGLEGALEDRSFFMRQATRQVFWSSSLLWNSSPKNITYHGDSYQNKHLFHVVICSDSSMWTAICGSGVLRTGPLPLMQTLSHVFSPVSGRVALAGMLYSEIGEHIDSRNVPKALLEREAQQCFGPGFDNCPQMRATVWEQEWLE